MIDQPLESILVLCSDRHHVDQHPLDELDAVVFVEHAGLDHAVDVLDRQTMHGHGDRNHVRRLDAGRLLGNGP